MSLTCICCKTLEHIIVSNINKHLAFESILADCQHGFRSQRSWETQLVQFFHDLVSNLDRALNRNHRQTDVFIMDFAKAFDKVPHRRLLYKLDYYGIRGSTHKWITSWLSGANLKNILVSPFPTLFLRYGSVGRNFFFSSKFHTSSLFVIQAIRQNTPTMQNKIYLYPPQTVFVGGYTFFTFSVHPSVCP